MIEKIKKNMFLLFSTFLILYFFINLLGGERGLISYFDKKKFYEELIVKSKTLTIELEELKHKILLVKNNDQDYLDMLYREKFKFGTKEEIVIKLNDK